ncbi:unnamed protein product [Larinioides sclopetarius]|uniref:Uncharacterized protein n=1 Tax=Larinioides sclopetarius TaxID=280406 RepID=A0AAV2ABW5_9ARAC
MIYRTIINPSYQALSPSPGKDCTEISSPSCIALQKANSLTDSLGIGVMGVMCELSFLVSWLMKCETQDVPGFMSIRSENYGLGLGVCGMDVSIVGFGGVGYGCVSIVGFGGVGYGCVSIVGLGGVGYGCVSIVGLGGVGYGCVSIVGLGGVGYGCVSIVGLGGVGYGCVSIVGLGGVGYG